jgi:hypothetical protein
VSSSPVNSPAAMASPNVLRPAAVPRSPAWFVRRAAIGLGMLIAFAFGGAMLLDASIDPAVEAEQAAQNER